MHEQIKLVKEKRVKENLVFSVGNTYEFIEQPFSIFYFNLSHTEADE